MDPDVVESELNCVILLIIADRIRKPQEISNLQSLEITASMVVFYFSILNIVQVYFFPLIVTVVCYSLILWKISEESSAKKKEAEVSSDALLRRSGVNTLERARSRTLSYCFARFPEVPINYSRAP
ncbi:hypothetical protein ANCDUO_12221 [Ancylostoma duodenale]|uniref:Uncharacterized protein n=1 Tax=Ancylostoma duodenale TaxID=51022 RepID=A0A0C2GF99_9BILA|nr:hypothetical protein ANCDUO_12221 [Ancylostoma duodenale]